MSWSITIRGTGPRPTVTIEEDQPAPPVVVPPAPSTGGAGGVTTAPAQGNAIPFAWPAQPPHAPYQEDERTIILGGSYYAALEHYRNPLPGMLAYAGTFAEGVTTAWGQGIAGLRLWAPIAGEPAQIRRVLATGRVL